MENFLPVGRCFTFGRDQISGGRDFGECPSPVQEKSATGRYHQGSEEALVLFEAGRTKAGQTGVGPKTEPEKESPGFRIINRG